MRDFFDHPPSKAGGRRFPVAAAVGLVPFVSGPAAVPAPPGREAFPSTPHPATMTPEEFTYAFSRQHVPLYSLALRLTHHREDAQDLVQETWIAAYRNRHKFTPGTNFRGWVSVIMRHTHVNQYRKDHSQKRRPLPGATAALFRESGRAVANEAEQTLRMQELSRMLASLGERYSIPFLMYYRGYQYHEIAAYLDIPIGTVKGRIFQARQRMRVLVGERA